ncbi:CPBP family intramembrane metalloprotease [Rathayibacter sp. VKM Ac-2803]|uniref:CPBP family glutamic-type intramembrane protease n=1 Tax=Rathayibacter sp. VKM Ac-2803 TaxID=2609256 RepID=UPI00135683BE|nr:CPBP family glutamic-type intramembrane protease [Rathayibacter sp. VKM Ac-2803]MWV48717.1 CPBP family intramembrane metalloprotease [Rathayibacter sp. VKM Ac-2803]
MSVAVGVVRRTVPRGAALLRAVVAWLILGAGLGAAIGAADALDQALGLPLLAVVLVQAVLMSALVVPAIALLRRRVDRRDLRGLGLTRRALRPLSVGVAVGAGSGLAVWLPAALAGWIRVEAVDPVAFAGFLLLNGVVIVLYEALPEELALRGYAWTNLRDGWGPAVATVVTTALFPFLGLVIGPVRWAVTTVLGGAGEEPAVFPAGNDPVVYVLQLVLFGLALVAARRLPIEGALLVAIAFHATQLTVTRTLLGGMTWAPSGWRVEFVEPDAIALVLLHILVAGAVLVGMRWARERAGRRRLRTRDRP